MSRVELLHINGESMSPDQIISFAREHPALVSVKEETVQDIEGSFYTLNYTEKANSMPAEKWHPITMRCRGLVAFKPVQGESSFVILPYPKFFNWPKGGELPDEVSIRRKVDGTCVHAVATALPGYGGLRWIVGTRNSLHSHQAGIAASMLPTPCAEHAGLTIMMELIDPDSDPHGETDAAVGSRGLRLLHAWLHRDKLSLAKLQALVPLLGEYASLVDQEVLPQQEFLNRFDDLENVTTRDEVKEGWVVEVDGTLFKYKSYTWLKWSEMRIVNERNLLKEVRKVLPTKGKNRPTTEQAILDLVKQGFAHVDFLSAEDRWNWSKIRASEHAILVAEMQQLFERAETHWEAGLCHAEAALVAAAGGLDQPIEKKTVFQISEAKPFALVAMAGGRAATIQVQEFLIEARRKHTLADSLSFLLAKLSRDE